MHDVYNFLLYSKYIKTKPEVRIKGNRMSECVLCVPRSAGVPGSLCTDVGYRGYCVAAT